MKLETVKLSNGKVVNKRDLHLHEGEEPEKKATVKELQEEIAKTDDLERLAELEKDSRKGVKEAAEARIDDLTNKGE